MRLRSRVTLALLLGVVPVVALAAWAQRELRVNAIVDTTTENILARMNDRERALCEADPAAWAASALERARRRADRRRGRNPRRPLELMVYDDTLRAADSRWPALDASMARALRSGEESASHVEGSQIVVATSMPWRSGRCAVIAVARPYGGVATRRSWLMALGVGALAMCVALLAIGTVVRRIRKLTKAVADGSQIPSQGGDEIAELARAFAANRDELRARLAELEARDTALTRFVSNTTHDVMLPLTVLIGHLAELDEHVRAGDGANATTVRAALEEAHYLTSLVQNLGVAAKLDVGEAHVVWHDVDLVPLVERVIARHTRIAQQRGVELAHAIPDTALVVRGDVTLIEQAVSNLVHNAVRYADTGGHVAVVLERNTPLRFELRVLDDGPGVPDALLTRLGERGFRTDEARTRQPQGFGLGLHIVHDVAKRLGLELRFARAAERGLLVTLSGTCLPPAPRSA